MLKSAGVLLAADVESLGPSEKLLSRCRQLRCEACHWKASAQGLAVYESHFKGPDCGSGVKTKLRGTLLVKEPRTSL